MESRDEDIKVEVKEEIPDQKPYLEQADMQWTVHVRKSPRKLTGNTSSGNQTTGVKNSEGAFGNHKELKLQKGRRCVQKATKEETRKGTTSEAELGLHTKGQERAALPKKEKGNISAETLAKTREKKMLYNRNRRANMTKEELAEFREKDKLQKRKKRAEKKEEKLTLQRGENLQAKTVFEGENCFLTNLTPAEKEKGQNQNCGYRKRWNARQKEARKNYTPEEREKYLECLKSSNKKRMERLKEGDGEAYKNHLEYYREYFRKRNAAETPEQRWKRRQGTKVYQTVRKLKEQMRIDGVSEEEIQVCAEALKAEMELKSEPMPPPEMISEYKPRPRECLRRARAAANPAETPEQKRWRRLQAYKVVQAVGRLKRQLKKDGLSEEEIQVCADALKAEMEMKRKPMPPPDEISKYKPRPRKNLRHAQSAAASGMKDKRLSTVKVPLSQANDSEVGPHVNWEQRKKPQESIFNVGSPQEEENGNDAGNDIFSPAHSPQDTCAKLSENSNDNLIMADEVVEPIHTIYSLTSQSSFLSFDKNSTESKDPIIDTAKSTSAGTVIEDSSASDSLTVPRALKYLKCPKCKESMTSFQKFLDHYKIYHDKKNSEMEISSATGKFTPNRNISEPAPEQNKSSTSAKISKYSLARSRTKPSFLCLKCPLKGKFGGKSFKTSDELRIHVRKVHPKYFWPCPHCKLLKYQKSSIDKHEEMCRKYFISESTNKRSLYT